MPFKFHRLTVTLLANIVSLQFTESSEYHLPRVIEHQNYDFSDTFTVNFPPQPTWRR